MDALIEYYKRIGTNYALAAPMGRAVAGKGCTLHHLLGLKVDHIESTTLAAQFASIRANMAKMNQLATLNVCRALVGRLC